MKKRLIIIIVSILFLLLMVAFIIYKKSSNEVIDNVEYVFPKSNLIFECYKEISLYDLFDTTAESIQSENTLIDTTRIGEYEVNIGYNQNRTYTIRYNVVDTEKPLIMASNRTVEKGSKVNFNSGIICGDNYDSDIKCNVEGDYDLNKSGTYKLKYVAIDTSNNKSEKDFVLTVKDKIKESSSSNPSKQYKISNLIKNHKNDNTMIGIDVSSWQGVIDWKKVKSSGVEFAMIRIGFGPKDGEYVYDTYFKDNLRNAKEAGIKVGLYFYSYATDASEGIKEAKWIVSSLMGEKLDLPIAFDWESWNKFNSYNININELRLTASAFIDELNKNGYEGVLYGSAIYLSKIWKLDKYRTWLAHYTDKTDYEGKYFMWQLSSSGKVNGINGNVDLNILYK